MDKLLIILGPTATGKTDLALELAKKIKGELISADSRQVYRGLDIGTGKEPSQKLGKIQKCRGYWIIDGIKIWMYDLVSPTIRYNVAQYKQDAEKKIEYILGQKKLPILIGGTGLYIKSVVWDLLGISIPVDENLREELEKLDLDWLQWKLRGLPLLFGKN